MSTSTFAFKCSLHRCTTAYGVTATVSNALVPQNDNTDEDQKVYADKSEVYGWLKDTFSPIWVGACKLKSVDPELESAW